MGFKLVADNPAVYREADTPRYIPGLWTTIALNIGSLVVLTILTLIFKKQNKRAERGEIEIEGAPGFLYTI
jgi:hypothetical protein